MATKARTKSKKVTKKNTGSGPVSKKTTQESSASQESRLKKKKNYDTFRTFIQKLLQDVHPGGISGGALDVVDSYVKINCDKLVRNSDGLLKRSKKKTLSEKEIESAVYLTVSDELAQEANKRGTEAVDKYVSNIGKKGTTQRSTKSSKAELIFPVSRVGERVKSASSLDGLRIGEKAIVFLTAVLEYLTQELLRMAGEVADTGKNKHKRITPRDIKLAINKDKGLEQLTRNVYIPGGVPVQPRKR